MNHTFNLYIYIYILHMYMYIYIYSHVYIYSYVYTQIYVSIYIYVCICFTHVFIHGSSTYTQLMYPHHSSKMCWDRCWHWMAGAHAPDTILTTRAAGGWGPKKKVGEKNWAFVVQKNKKRFCGFVLFKEFLWFFARPFIGISNWMTGFRV